jgi:hypothetical protein
MSQPDPSSSSSSSSVSSSSSPSDKKPFFTNPFSSNKSTSSTTPSADTSQKPGFFSSLKSGFKDMVNNGKNPFVPASPAKTTTAAAETTAAAGETTAAAETTTHATDSGFDMGAFMNALNNLEPDQPQKPPDTIQGTVTYTPPDESDADTTTNELAQEGDTNTNTEKPTEQSTEQKNTPETKGEPVQVTEEKKSKIKNAISGLIGKLNLSGPFDSILKDVNSQLMVDLMKNMANASTANASTANASTANASTNKPNNNNSKTLTFLILYENGANVIKNQEINVLPALPFNIKIHNTPFTLNEDGKVQNNGTESGIEFKDVSPDTIKIIICMHNNDVYAIYSTPTPGPTSGGRKTRNRHKKHNKNKSGVHKPHRERQRRTIKKHIKYRCNKKTYKIDIIIQLPE